MPMISAVHVASVASGGAIGASLRYALGLWLPVVSGKLPWAVLVANICGCFIAGLLLGIFQARGTAPPIAWQLFLFTGVLGGFTTFSAFSVDSLRLLQSGETLLAAANVMLNLVGTLLAVSVGWYLARSVFSF